MEKQESEPLFDPITGAATMPNGETINVGGGTYYGVKATSIEDTIRRIVREEIAAHEGRPEVTKLSDEKKQVLNDYLKLKPTI